MSAVQLLGQAQQILNTRHSGLSARLAAFLARQALEDIVIQRCANAGAPAPRATMRSRLLILRGLWDSAAEPAAFAWNQLSDACHLHAYEMQPAVSEIRHLCEVVAQLLPLDDLPPDSAPSRIYFAELPKEARP